jgi:hypothetical protein
MKIEERRVYLIQERIDKRMAKESRIRQRRRKDARKKKFYHW